MAGYAYVNQIADEPTSKAVGKLAADLAALTTKVAALETAALNNTTTINANGQRLTNLAAPDAESDAATVAFVRAYVNARVGTL